MQSETQSKTIDGDEYSVYFLSPKISRRLFVKVVKAVLPGLGPMLDAGAKGGLTNIMEQEVGSEFFTKAAGLLAENIDSTLLDELCETLEEVTHVNGKPLKAISEIQFRGRLDKMFKWLIFAMQVQWGPIVPALKNTIANQGGLNTMVQKSKSPSISIG